MGDRSQAEVPGVIALVQELQDEAEEAEEQAEEEVEGCTDADR